MSPRDCPAGLASQEFIHSLSDHSGLVRSPSCSTLKTSGFADPLGRASKDQWQLILLQLSDDTS
jgi:hypothetical protein